MRGWASHDVKIFGQHGTSQSDTNDRGQSIVSQAGAAAAPWKKRMDRAADPSAYPQLDARTRSVALFLTVAYFARLAVGVAWMNAYTGRYHVTADRTPTGRPHHILFVGDDGSTQIAASLLRRLIGDRAEVGTAGVDRADPGSRQDEMLVAMGLDPADGQRLSARVLRSADQVIALGPGVDVARVPGPRYEEWDVTAGNLVGRVETLATELTAVPTEAAAEPLLARMRTLLRVATGR